MTWQALSIIPSPAEDEITQLLNEEVQAGHAALHLKRGGQGESLVPPSYYTRGSVSLCLSRMQLCIYNEQGSN